jgi:FAD/FMN-containing dehydrogenase
VTPQSRADLLGTAERSRARRFKSFRYWKNAEGNQRVLPLRIYDPTTCEQLVAIVEQAQDDGVTVRAVGSHHAWSDAALTDGYVVETHGLHQFFREIKDARTSTENLVRVEAGIRLRALNEELLSRGQALLNMGGYDGQTLGGAISTSTHGSGVAFGPMSDVVVSLDVVASDGQCIRIEPEDGITDQDKFEQSRPEWPKWQLVKNDERFHSAQVSIGCFGIIYAATIEVIPAYWLTERRRIDNWRELERKLGNRHALDKVLDEHRHYEIYINPYPTTREQEPDHVCVVTTRDTTKVGPHQRPQRSPRRRNALQEFGLTIPFVRRLIVFLFANWPKLGPKLLAIGLKSQANHDFTSHSFRVLSIGNANLLPAICSEISVPVDDDGTHVKAVREVLKKAKVWRDQGRIYHAGYISLRFVRESPAFLSMMYGRPVTMAIELFILHPIRGSEELLSAYEDALSKLGGRPHWGQFNRIAGDRETLAAMYSKFPVWEDVERQLNSSGVFDSPMTKRVGFTLRGALP